MTSPNPKRSRLSKENNQFDQSIIDLSESLRKPRPLSSLCNYIALGLSDEVIRRYAASELLDRICEDLKWIKLTAVERTMIMQCLLQIIANEPDKSIKYIVARCITAVLEKEGGQWKELFPVLVKLVQSDDEARKEVGVFILDTFAKNYSKMLSPHGLQVGEIVAELLKHADDDQLQSAPYIKFAERILLHLPAIMSVNKKVQNKEVPSIGTALPVLIRRVLLLTLHQREENVAVNTLETLTGLLDNYNQFFSVQLIKRMEELCLTVTKDNRLGDEIRKRAFGLLESLIIKSPTSRYEPNVLAVLHSFKTVLSETSSGGGDDDSLEMFAIEKFESVCHYLRTTEPPLPLSDIVESGKNSADPLVRRTAQVAISAMIFGRRQDVSRDIDRYLEYVFLGIADEDKAVQFAALRTLLKFVVNVDLMSKKTDEMIPFLLNQYEFTDKNRSQYLTTLKYCFMAAAPPTNLLNSVVSILMKSASERNPSEIRKLALAVLKEAAFASEDDMAPYIFGLLEMLKKSVLEGPAEDDLKFASIGLLHSLCCCVRRQYTYSLLFKEIIEVALKIVDSFQDSAERSKAHKLFGVGILQ